jgi:pyridoxal phosphate enzyme (YggS family)
MIGHLQRNKVKSVLPHARVLHSLDSERLAEEVQKVAERLEIDVDAFVEVNVSGEDSKHGIAPRDLPAMLAATADLPRIRLRGLMTMAPLTEDPEEVRPCFARLRQLLEKARQADLVGPDCLHLSMGMSHDYAVAIQEGATFVRVGSALFDGLDLADE